jgi:predicted Ser/Thr protein kinase
MIPLRTGATLFSVWTGLDGTGAHVRICRRNYGTERRVLLLHGPVGTAKSTIVRLLKKGLEAYSRTEDGQALFILLGC